MRALIVLLWRASLRISEASALAESDLDPLHGSVLVRRRKGGTGQFRASSNKAVSDPSLEHSCLQLSALRFVPELPGSSRGTSAATSPRVNGRREHMGNLPGPAVSPYAAPRHFARRSSVHNRREGKGRYPLFSTSNLYRPGGLRQAPARAA
jgi:hypothetical protein